MAQYLLLIAIALACAVDAALQPSNAFLEMSTQRVRRSSFPTTATYARWANPTAIPYFFESGFPEGSKAAVRDAAAAVTNALGSNCIAFTEVTTAPTDPYIVISDRTRPNGQGSSQALICDANPGRFRRGNPIVNYMSVVTAPSSDTARLGCETNQRVLRGLFFRILGFHAEYERADRDSSISVNRGGMHAAASASIAVSPRRGSDSVSIGLFDFSSITIPDPAYFSGPANTAVFTANGGEAFGNADNVPSRLDCMAARMLYRTSNSACDPNTCPAA